MLVPQATFDGEERPYHLLDWKSSKLPRIARSSLGAESQAAGQAVDAVDFCSRFWGAHATTKPRSTATLGSFQFVEAGDDHRCQSSL